jgi:class 3 adenylate cyclase
MTTTRRLSAILAADVAGYSRLTGTDEVGTLETLKTHRREVVDPAITANHGRIVKTRRRDARGVRERTALETERRSETST